MAVTTAWSDPAVAYPSGLDRNATQNIPAALWDLLISNLNALGGTDGATATGRRGLAKGADIVSAATVNLALATGNLIHITGATGPITSFGVCPAGTPMWLVFDSTPTVTYNAVSMILAGGVSFVATAGSAMLVVSEGAGNWKEHGRNTLGFTSPMTTIGDMIDGNTSGVARRVAPGTARQALLMDAAATGHAYGDSLASLLTAKGHLPSASAANTPLGVAVGANDTVLVAASGQASGLAWSATLAGLTLTSPILGGAGAATAGRLGFSGTRILVGDGTVNEVLDVGPWTAFTPTLNQSGAVTCTVNLARYCIVGKLAIVQVRLTATGAGGGSTAITVAALPAAITMRDGTATNSIGVGYVNDAGVSNYVGTCMPTSTTSFGIQAHALGNQIGGTPAFTLANTDQVSAVLMYEIA